MLVSGLKRMFYNGLPVCAICERVNRYIQYNRNILTAPEIYAILKTAGNSFLLSQKSLAAVSRERSAAAQHQSSSGRG